MPNFALAWPPLLFMPLAIFAFTAAIALAVSLAAALPRRRHARRNPPLRLVAPLSGLEHSGTVILARRSVPEYAHLRPRRA